MQHIWQRTTGHRYEVIVVDNGSHPEEIQFLQKTAKWVRIIPLGINRYFGEANNIGVEAARGRISACSITMPSFMTNG